MRQLKLSAYFSRLFVLLSLAVLAACGDGDNSIRSPDIPGGSIQAITVSCTPSMMFVGDTGSCTAFADICRIVETGDDEFERRCSSDDENDAFPPENVTDVVNWRSTDPDIVAVDQDGNFTGEAEGSAEVVATLDGVSGRDTVTVTEAALTGLAVECPTEIFVGQTKNDNDSPDPEERGCIATGSFEDGDVRDVSNVVDWTSADNTLISVNDSGHITGEGVDQNPDTVVITASCSPPDCVTDTGMEVSDSDSVVVRTLDVSSLDVTPDTSTIPPLCTQQYTATATFEDGSTQDVSDADATVWAATAPTSVDDTGLAIGGPAGSADTMVTATFTDEAGNAVSDMATLSIQAGIDVASLCVEPSDSENTTPGSDINSPNCNKINDLTRPTNVSVFFQAKLIYDDGTTVCPLTANDGRTTWSSTNTAVAEVDDPTTGTVQTKTEGATDVVADFNDTNSGTVLQDDHPLFVSDSGNSLVDYKVLPEFSCVGFFDVASGLQDSDELPASQQMRAVGKYLATGWSCDVDGDGDNDGDAELGTQDFTNNPERCAGDLTASSTWTAIRGYYDRSSDTCIRTDESIPDQDVPGGTYQADGSIRLGVNCLQGVPDADTSLSSAGTVVVLPVTNDFLVADGAELCEALQPLLTVGDGALLEVVSAVANTLDPALVAIFSDQAIPIDSILEMVLAPLSDELTSQLIGDGGPLEVLIDTLDDTYGQLNCLIGGILDALLGGNSECQL